MDIKKTTLQKTLRNYLNTSNISEFSNLAYFAYSSSDSNKLLLVLYDIDYLMINGCLHSLFPWVHKVANDEITGNTDMRD